MAEGRKLQLAGAALACAAAGLVVPPLALVAVGLGAAAFVASRRRGERRGQVLGLASIALAVAGLTALGLLALPALRAQKAAARGAECRVGLGALLLADEDFRRRTNRYAGTREELGVWPARPGFEYFLEPSGPHEQRLRALKVGRVGACPACTATVACAADAGEGRVEWWTASTAERTSAEGARVLPGTATQENAGD